MDTYEEKYNEALEKARQLCAYPTTKPFINDLQNLFPELKDSEDEKIRKEIINYLEPQGDCCGNKERWIAWLEKQGTPAKLSEEEQNRFAKGVLTSCAMSFIDYLDAHKYEGKMCVSNGECEDIENAFHNAMWDRLHRYYCKYIEKQGKQKTVPKFEVGDVMRTLQEPATSLWHDARKEEPKPLERYVFVSDMIAPTIQGTFTRPSQAIPWCEYVETYSIVKWASLDDLLKL